MRVCLSPLIGSKWSGYAQKNDWKGDWFVRNFPIERLWRAHHLSQAVRTGVAHCPQSLRVGAMWTVRGVFSMNWVVLEQHHKREIPRSEMLRSWPVWARQKIETFWGDRTRIASVSARQEAGSATLRMSNIPTTIRSLSAQASVSALWSRSFHLQFESTCIKCIRGSLMKKIVCLCQRESLSLCITHLPTHRSFQVDFTWSWFWHRSVLLIWQLLDQLPQKFIPFIVLGLRILRFVFLCGLSDSINLRATRLVVHAPGHAGSWKTVSALCFKIWVLCPMLFAHFVPFIY